MEGQSSKLYAYPGEANGSVDYANFAGVGNGQCQQGEILYLLSTVGGGPRADIQSIGYCSRGNYAFCCDGPDLSDITSGCRWTGW